MNSILNKGKFVLLITLFLPFYASCQDVYTQSIIKRLGQSYESENLGIFAKFDSTLSVFYKDSTIKAYVIAKQKKNINTFDHFTISIGNVYRSADCQYELTGGHILYVRYLSGGNPINTYSSPLPESEWGLFMTYETQYEVLIDKENYRYICVRNTNLPIRSIRQFNNLDWNEEIVDAIEQKSPDTLIEESHGQQETHIP